MSYPEHFRTQWTHSNSPNRRGRSSSPGALSVILAIVLAAFLAGLNSARAEVGARSSGGLVSVSEARTGTLLFKTQEEGRFVEAPRLGSDFDISVSGPTARGRLTQHFVNPTDGWVEAVYVFPLPETAAVDTMKMVIGQRIIVGRIAERKQAKIIYEKAKRAGKKASLIEQERPNIFTQSVANIGPGEAIVIQLEYQQSVKRSGDEFSLRVPLVVAPRYNPKPIVQTVDFKKPGGDGSSPENNSGWANVLDPVPDRERISPPVLDPAKNAPVNPVTMTIRLQAGFQLGEVNSHHHAIDLREEADGGRLIKLAKGAEPANRDFELTWTGKSAKTPEVGLFHERVGEEDYVLAFVTPPVASSQAAKDNAAYKPRREIVFVIDTSGSMGGTSIVQARKSLLFGLNRLGPEDRFNVIEFNSNYQALFPDTVEASGDNVAKALEFVAGLEADGGTEMVQPMLAALNDSGAADGSFLRQVVFLTDGAIGNEQQLFEAVGTSRGRSRVFMVGIGSAPNAHLMNRAAEMGRGTFTHIGSQDQVGKRMRELFSKLESPVVTGLQAKFSDNGQAADVTPGQLSDLYKGEPVVVVAKVGGLAGALEIEGLIGRQPWQVTLPLQGAAVAPGISKIWARRKIADAEVDMLMGRANREEGDARILALALGHGLVSRLTSLVAVDDTPSRPQGEVLTRADVPLNLPDGWVFEKVFGTKGEGRIGPFDGRADGALPGMPKFEKARFAQVARKALPNPPVQQTQKTVVLPKSATDAEIRFMIGLALVLLALAWLFAGRMAWSRR
ncbi:MAG: marine proteobacterial sortase target protein [Alphaproteobacteria bacterium]|nr:marine proteobacterial sortase target protein [Alphaproteobacteria bacterium]